MNKRKCKKLFYKESAKWLLKRGWTDGYISPNTIKYVVRKLEKLTKLKLLYYLHNKVEEDCFVIRKEVNNDYNNTNVATICRRRHCSNRIIILFVCWNNFSVGFL